MAVSHHQADTPTRIHAQFSMFLQTSTTDMEVAPAVVNTDLQSPEKIHQTWTMPIVNLDDMEIAQPLISRRGVIAAKASAGAQRAAVFEDTKGMRPSSEKNALYKIIHDLADEATLLEDCLQNQFVPQHDTSQFLGPRAFFQSALFSPSNRSAMRKSNVRLVLAETAQKEELIWYEGPDLRQSDGRVFLALLHMLRDIRVGTEVCIEPEAVCKAIFGRYDGNSRRQLRTHIQTLQKGLIVTGEFRVQLCKVFGYPKFGPWTVALHPHIVEIFRMSPKVWLSIPTRLGLTEGLVTWLFSYIECQTRLIPMGIEQVRLMCGTEAKLESFTNSLRAALRELAKAGIIDSGWAIGRGKFRWMKARSLKNRSDI
jgi:hypothetical protein